MLTTLQESYSHSTLIRVVYRRSNLSAGNHMFNSSTKIVLQAFFESFLLLVYFFTLLLLYFITFHS
jgi:hypothetical protein